jgi:hypothetical protein
VSATGGLAGTAADTTTEPLAIAVLVYAAMDIIQIHVSTKSMRS